MPGAWLRKQDERSIDQYEMRARCDVDSCALLLIARCPIAINSIGEGHFSQIVIQGLMGQPLDRRASVAVPEDNAMPEKSGFVAT